MSATLKEPSRQELLELDLDARMHSVWRQLDGLDPKEHDLVLLATVARAAYAHGYLAALTESERGQLFSEHGYPVPARAS